MSFQRSILVAIATLITVGMTQVAFAQNGCGGCGTAALRPGHLRNTDCTGANRRRLRQLRRAGDVLCAERCGLVCRAGRPMGRRLRRLRSPVGTVATAAAMAAAIIAAAAIAAFPRSIRPRRRSMSSTRVRPLRVRASWCRTTATRRPWNTLRLRPIRRMRAVMRAVMPAVMAVVMRGGYAHRYYPHVAYGGQGYYHPHMMAPHYGYGARPYMMHRPYWRG